MRNKYIFLAMTPVIIIFGVVLAPCIEGYIFKKNYLDFIANVNADNNYKIDVLDYQAGWFQSAAKLSVTTAKPQNMPGMQFNVIVDQKIMHGPFLQDPIKKEMTFALAAIQTQLHAPEPFETILLGNKKAQGFLQINSLVNFQYEAWNQISSPSLSINTPEIGNLQWQGLNGDVYFHTLNHSNIDSIKSSFTLGALSFTSTNSQIPVQQITTQPITYTSDFFTPTSHIFTGKTEVSIPQITIKELSGTDIALNKFNSQHTFSLNNNNLYNIASKFTINRLDLPDFAVPVIAPISINYALNNLNANALVVAIKQKRLVPSIDPRQQVEEFLPQIFTPSSSIDLNTSMNTTLGILLINGHAFWPANVAIPKTVEEIGMNASATINIKIATALLTKLIEEYADTTPYATSQTTSATRENEINLVNDAVAKYIKQGVIQLPIALQIMQLGATKLSPEAFAASISRFNLPPAIVNDLKQQYVAQAAKTESATAPQLSAADIMKQQLAAYIQQGYIIQDGDNYTTSIVRQNGITTLNGKTL